jgi:hypothetical protein
MGVVPQTITQRVHKYWKKLKCLGKQIEKEIAKKSFF